MLALSELQRQFAITVFDGSCAFTADLALLDSLSTAQRMEVYRSSIYGNYRAALADVYPVVKRLIGEACFDSVATHFIQLTPSPSGDIHQFGAEFPQYLLHHPALADLNYLSDVASLEWQMHEIYYEDELPPLDISALSALPQDVHGDIVFTLTPACRLFVSPFPIDRIWQANQPDVVAPEEIYLDAGGARMLVRRREGVLELQPLSQAAYVLLEWISRGQRFGDALLAALVIQPDFDVAPFLLQEVQLGNLVDFYLPVVYL